MNPSSPIAPSFKAAIGGFFVLLILHILVWVLFQWPTIMLYPVHLLAYYLVGRVAAGNALSEDPTGAGIEINFASIGGVSGLILGILIWGFQGIASSCWK